MPMTKFSRGNFLHAIGNRAVRQAVSALGLKASTGYELTTPAGAATGLNGPNRVRNSTALVTEPNLSVDVAGGGLFYQIRGKLFLSLTAANGIKFDFGASTAAIVAGTLGGTAKFTAAATGTTLAVALTALSTAVSGGTTGAWIEADIDFAAQFSDPGQVTLEFAQVAAGATNTDILPGSYLTAIPLDHTPESA